MHAIKARNVVKVYDDPSGRVKALDGVSFEVDKGEIFGLLGPNGAGKSTLINMITGLISSTSGNIKIFGKDVATDWYSVKEMTGTCFGFARFIYFMTGRENLRFFGYLYDMSDHEIDKRIDELAQTLRLSEIDSRAGTYSSGMTQKLSLMKGLLHNPKLLLVDELTVGLDVDAAMNVRNVFRQVQRDEGTTVLLTTHYMQEANDLCNRIALISKGKLYALDTPKKLKRLARDYDVIEITLKQAKKAEAIVRRQKGVLDVFVGKDRLVAKVSSSEKSLQPVIGGLLKKGFMFTNLKVRKPMLEEVFLSLTGQSLGGEWHEF
ncbi:MAG: ABC transporter ATP-binding protein [Candidatus Diapherotrites archaeon]|nr:ABC transporter ATP-binding protein [Candidatus Diapherotrites archaeon]